MGDLRSKTLCPTCLFGWSSAVTRFLATLQCESIEHMSSLERENRRRIGVPERTTVLKRVFSTRNRTEIPIPASICCSDEPILRYSRNQSLFPAYLLQFRPNGQKTDMLRSSEWNIDAGNGIFGRFPVEYTMPDMFDWLEHRGDSIASNFAVCISERYGLIFLHFVGAVFS